MTLQVHNCKPFPVVYLVRDYFTPKLQVLDKTEVDIKILDSPLPEVCDQQLLHLAIKTLIPATRPCLTKISLRQHMIVATFIDVRLLYFIKK